MLKNGLAQQIASLFNNKEAPKILLNFVIGIAVIIILICFKLLIESHSVGKRVELLTYEFLNRQISPFSTENEIPIVVVNISQIPLENGVTSRKKLKEIITELINQKAYAIAIDIDFTLNEKGWRDNKNDPEFFDFCLEQKEQNNVPVLLGVFPTSAQKSNNWLGEEKFRKLAADIRIFHQNATRITIWSQKGEDEKLYSISGGLFKTSKSEFKRPPSLIQFILEDQDHIELDDKNGKLKTATMLVNYSKLEAIQSQSLPAISEQSIKDLGSKFKNKLVIIGDGAYGKATDTFIVPGRDKPVPGVYLHASALYTLMVEPFYELKHWSRLIIDFLLGLFILLIIAIMRWRNSGKTTNWEKKQKRIIYLTIIFCFIIGILAVRILHILWLDFFLVIFVLLLHPAVENKMYEIFKIHNQDSDSN